MNQKEILNEYLLTLKQYSDKNNYEKFLNLYYAYNVPIKDKYIDISSNVNSIKDNIIKLFSENKIKCNLKETNKELRISIIYNKDNYPTTKVKMYIPIFLENYEQISTFLIKYLLEEKINFSMSLSKIYRNDLIIIKFNSVGDAQKLFSYYKKDKDIKLILKSKANPLIPYYDDVAITTDFKGFDYLSYFTIILYDYFKKEKSINIETLLNYLEKLYSSEKIHVMKKMYYIYYKALEIINNADKPYNLFEYNANMNFGSYDSSLYDLKTEENGLIYFINKENKMIISFGTEDYLNLTYSKFYSNVIEKSEGLTFYNYFLNIYNNLMFNNFKNMKELLSFEDTNKDNIYQIMMCISSGFFAMKKIGFSLEEVNKMLVDVLSNKLKSDIKIKTEGEILESKNIFVFPFSVEYGNQVIDLKNGKKTTIISYFKKYNVLNTISLKCNIIFKDGTTMNGELFLKNISDYSYKYDNFSDLINDLIDIIELPE